MTEMEKLVELLTAHKVPFQVKPHWEDSVQILYPSDKDEERICDAVCFPGSYGYASGLIEIMGLVDLEKIGDDVEGWLTAQEVFDRIWEHYKTTETYKYYSNSKTGLSEIF